MKYKKCLSENKLVLLYGNNQAYLAIARDSQHHGRTKAIDVRYYHIRDLIARSIVTPDYIPTKHILADDLIKALSKQQLEDHKRAYSIY